ncbi:uncharacterized protein METZ01_LOCUS107765 [marine metagenome]|uniref:Nitroreductase domain-containing protein n=1 Tax=marine metagenome TaxID=408172 RepID=A0A381WRJ2_9ZZZZ
MEVYDAMRTTFAARDYTDAEVSDETLYRILDNARFAPSGGNRQGWKVLVVKDRRIRLQLKEILGPTIRQYRACQSIGETPFTSVGESQVTQAMMDATPTSFPLVDALEDAPVLLVVCVDLKEVCSFDKDLDRVGVISGGSVYPFAWNTLLAARNEKLGGVLTTYLAHREEEVRDLLEVPADHAVAAMISIGEPVKQLKKLKRNPVASFTVIDSFGGPVFEG